MHDFLHIADPAFLLDVNQIRKPSNRKPDQILVSFTLPKALREAVDRLAKAQDSDRSKIIRAALRARLQRTA